MLRRLHLEEASRASHLRAPAKDGENQENQGESELAIEFSRLLDQVQGPIAAAHDEVMALGLALAQAIPFVQQSKQDVQEREVSDQGQAQQNDFEEQGLDVAVDSGDTNDSGDQFVSGSCATSAAQVGDKKQIGTEVSADRAIKQEGGNSDKLLAGSLNLGAADTSGVEVKVEQALGSPEAAAAVEASAVDETEVQVVLAQLNDTGGVQNQGLQQHGAEAAISLQKSALVSQGDDASDDDDQDGAESAGDSASSSEVMLNADDVEVRQTKIRAVKNPAEQAEKIDNPGAAQGSHSSAPQDAAKPEACDFKAVSSEGRQALEQRLQRQREPVSKLAQSIQVESDSSSESLAMEPGRSASATFDAAFQMTLLRQAFESLRSQRPDGNDAKQRQSMTQAAAVGTAAEAKTAAADTGERGAKQLSRPQLRRMLERVESTLKEAARSRDGKTISLRLDPAQLGRVKVDVSLREGTLHARITPENQQVLTALREHAHELQGALRKLGLNVDSVTVTVSSEAGQELSDFGRELNNGKSFQEGRNKMPNDEHQVAESTIGNEFAEPEAVGPQLADLANTDHWVA